MIRIGQKIKDLRLKMGMNQVPFGKMLGVSQARISAWETGLETPPCEWLIMLGNLAITRKSPPDPDDLCFWHVAGLDTQDAMIRAAGRTLADRAVEPSKQKGVVWVHQLGGGGVPLYMDARFVPNPSAAAYLAGGLLSQFAEPKKKAKMGSATRRKAGVSNAAEGRWAELSRLAPSPDVAEYFAKRAGLPPSSGMYLQHPYPSEVIVIDTSTNKLQDLWQRTVVIESKGPLDNLNARGRRLELSVGKFYCEPSLDVDRPRFIMRFEVSGREAELFSQERQSFRLAICQPPLAVTERQILVDGLSPYGPPPDKRTDYVKAMAKAFDMAVQEFSLPKGISIRGAVIAYFENPNWLKRHHGVSPPKTKTANRGAKMRG